MNKYTTNEIIDCLSKRQLEKTIKYHPTLHKYFNDGELKLIFSYPADIGLYKQEIDEIKRYCKEHNQTTIKQIMGICKFLFPSFIAGFYDCEHNIELSTDLIPGEVLIEQDDDENKRTKILTKEEFISIYSGKYLF